MHRVRVGHSSTMTIHVRPATIADAPQLSQLGVTTFRETFEGENTPADMARYLAEAFSPDRQAAEITDPASTVLLAEHRGTSGDAELVGYAHLVSGPAPEAVRGAAPVELKRLYVARAWHGQRVAQALMHAVLRARRRCTDGLATRPAARGGAVARPYLSGEKSVGVAKTDSTFTTIGPSASEAARTRCHSGSARNASQLCRAASRLG